MSFRSPKNLPAQLEVETGASVLGAEILAEKASSLGRAGQAVERALGNLKRCAEDDPNRGEYVQTAARSVHGYFVQRELCGFANHEEPTKLYAIPKEVLVRIGT